MSDNKNLIQNGLDTINQKLEGHDTKLIAVSKTKPKEDIEFAYKCGQKNFGENKVQDLLEKAQHLDLPGIKWHFIGHLQSNKINMLLKTPNLVSIHSIDTIQLLHKLLDKKPGRPIGVFLQINTSGESQKSGFESQQEVEKAIELLDGHSDFYFQGLMTIGKIRTDNFEQDAIRCFQKIVSLKQDISQKMGIDRIELLMGMSNDYSIALELGSNWIRVGSDIFGKRLI